MDSSVEYGLPCYRLPVPVVEGADPIHSPSDPIERDRLLFPTAAKANAKDLGLQLLTNSFAYHESLVEGLDLFRDYLPKFESIVCGNTAVGNGHYHSQTGLLELSQRLENILDEIAAKTYLTTLEAENFSKLSESVLGLNRALAGLERSSDGYEIIFNRERVSQELSFLTFYFEELENRDFFRNAKKAFQGLDHKTDLKTYSNETCSNNFQPNISRNSIYSKTEDAYLGKVRTDSSMDAVYEVQDLIDHRGSLQSVSASLRKNDLIQKQGFSDFSPREKKKEVDISFKLRDLDVNRPIVDGGFNERLYTLGIPPWNHSADVCGLLTPMRGKSIYRIKEIALKGSDTDKVKIEEDGFGLVRLYNIEGLDEVKYRAAREDYQAIEPDPAWTDTFATEYLRDDSHLSDFLKLKLEQAKTRADKVSILKRIFKSTRPVYSDHPLIQEILNESPHYYEAQKAFGVSGSCSDFTKYFVHMLRMNSIPALCIGSFAMSSNGIEIENGHSRVMWFDEKNLPHIVDATILADRSYELDTDKLDREAEEVLDSIASNRNHQEVRELLERKAQEWKIPKPVPEVADTEEYYHKVTETILPDNEFYDLCLELEADYKAFKDSLNANTVSLVQVTALDNLNRVFHMQLQLRIRDRRFDQEAISLCERTEAGSVINEIGEYLQKTDSVQKIDLSQQLAEDCIKLIDSGTELAGLVLGSRTAQYLLSSLGLPTEFPYQKLIFLQFIMVKGLMEAITNNELDKTKNSLAVINRNFEMLTAISSKPDLVRTIECEVIVAHILDVLSHINISKIVDGQCKELMLEMFTSALRFVKSFNHDLYLDYLFKGVLPKRLSKRDLEKLFTEADKQVLLGLALQCIETLSGEPIIWARILSNLEDLGIDLKQIDEETRRRICEVNYPGLGCYHKADGDFDCKRFPVTVLFLTLDKAVGLRTLLESRAYSDLARSLDIDIESLPRPTGFNEDHCAQLLYKDPFRFCGLPLFAYPSQLSEDLLDYDERATALVENAAIDFSSSKLAEEFSFTQAAFEKRPDLGTLAAMGFSVSDSFLQSPSLITEQFLIPKYTSANLNLALCADCSPLKLLYDELRKNNGLEKLERAISSYLAELKQGAKEYKAYDLMKLYEQYLPEVGDYKKEFLNELRAFTDNDLRFFSALFINHGGLLTNLSHIQKAKKNILDIHAKNPLIMKFLRKPYRKSLLIANLREAILDERLQGPDELEIFSKTSAFANALDRTLGKSPDPVNLSSDFGYNPQLRPEARRNTSHIGGSGEFIEYRRYIQGDDVRKVDWKKLARTRKLFVKLHDTEATHQPKHITYFADLSSFALTRGINGRMPSYHLKTFLNAYKNFPRAEQELYLTVNGTELLYLNAKELRQMMRAENIDAFCQGLAYLGTAAIRNKLLFEGSDVAVREGKYNLIPEDWQHKNKKATVMVLGHHYNRARLEHKVNELREQDLTVYHLKPKVEQEEYGLSFRIQDIN